MGFSGNEPGACVHVSQRSDNKGVAVVTTFGDGCRDDVSDSFAVDHGNAYINVNVYDIQDYLIARQECLQ